MKRWNIIQDGIRFRVKGATTSYFSPTMGPEPLSATLGVIVQSPTVKHPEEWPCRQLGAAQLELAADNAEDRLARLRQTYEDAMNH